MAQMRKLRPIGGEDHLARNKVQGKKGTLDSDPSAWLSTTLLHC